MPGLKKKRRVGYKSVTLRVSAIRGVGGVFVPFSFQFSPHLISCVFLGLSVHNSQLLAAISDQQRIGEKLVTELKHLMEICAREENLAQSKRLAQAGGYAFDAKAPVPNTFNFG